MEASLWKRKQFQMNFYLILIQALLIFMLVSSETVIENEEEFEKFLKSSKMSRESKQILREYQREGLLQSKFRNLSWVKWSNAPAAIELIALHWSVRDSNFELLAKNGDLIFDRLDSVRMKCSSPGRLSNPEMSVSSERDGIDFIVTL
ncbi:hypothetical protein GCK72_005100 [Caenorhabditis remanei]|uniref:Uncharacterized protein n=1 Tax=Caenorhabditis remanei TaxID=31234 RepID=A0A6A5HBH6_CAERE|nr:hypothetical protein GCK72_005100 [Caenorhabditis remanei]KAF1765148.1 hypothetical protein GCK72_005100 [Caenorhabditis remanei]